VFVESKRESRSVASPFYKGSSAAGQGGNMHTTITCIRLYPRDRAISAPSRISFVVASWGRLGRISVLFSFFRSRLVRYIAKVRIVRDSLDFLGWRAMRGRG
jgi:hypothetical protein